MPQLDRRSLLAAPAVLSLAPRAARARAAVDAQDAVGLAARIRVGELSSLEAVDAAITRAERVQPKLNFLVTDGFAQARERARAGRLTGPFAGVPFLVKDLNQVAGLPTRSGSRLLQDSPPELKQNSYIDRLTGGGLVVIGKSATPEGGFSPTTEPLSQGPTHNPWDLQRSSGGSSGGSAAAVAAGVVPAAHANDGGGSIRVPASCCGLVGLKPSRGVQQRDPGPTGPIDYAAQHVVSRSVRDTAALLALTEAVDPPPGLQHLGLVQPDRQPALRIGVAAVGDTGLPPEPEVAAALRDAAGLLGDLGHRLEQARWPLEPAFLDDFLLFWGAGAARMVQTAKMRLGRAPTDRELEPVTLGLAEAADRAGATGQAAAVVRLKAAGDAFNSWLARYDVVLTPVMREPPIRLGEIAPDRPYDAWVARVKRYMGYTPIHNVSGAPAISLPLHWTRAGLPIGLQLSAPPGGDAVLLRLAYQLEAARPWAARRPPLRA